MRRRLYDEPTFRKYVAISSICLHFVDASSISYSLGLGSNTSKQIMRDWNSFMISSYAFDISSVTVQTFRLEFEILLKHKYN